MFVFFFFSENNDFVFWFIEIAVDCNLTTASFDSVKSKLILTRTKCFLPPRASDGFSFSRIDNLTQDGLKVRLLTQSNQYMIEMQSPEKVK